MEHSYFKTQKKLIYTDQVKINSCIKNTDKVYHKNYKKSNIGGIK